ncbi:hypothetical protein DFH07DRAFT_746210 [Mycena maculata]|uniref:Uncharacterized protein n=1 Tax=Mycena maculata TaxID=230809 RepID=A0AAD7IX47_9AGAR|nr:hypothetical protein DFH07DRAFT_746210 [Mycena maculata]
MPSLFTLVTLLALTTPSVLAGSSCVAFDTAWNLLAFGFNGKDYNAGTSDTWASVDSSSPGSATDITTTGRPPFNGNNTKCYLAEFFNAVYVLGADTANINDIYIYDAGAKNWSQQTITPVSGFDTSTYQAILDHDTNVFYALSNGELYSLNMGTLASAQSTAIPWVDQEAAGITTTNYNPTMAIAQNHIYFFGVPGVAAGSAPIFVIHFEFWQTDAQSYGGSFPDGHGQATSFFLDSVVQENIAFIPDDGSQTYIVNVQFNTTETMAGPSIVDAEASYFASETALVQLASSGVVSWLPFSPNDTTTNSAAKWSTVQSLATVAPPSSGSSTGSGSSASKTATKGATSGASTGTSTGSSSTASGSSGATRQVVWGSGIALGLATVALTLL